MSDNNLVVRTKEELVENFLKSVQSLEYAMEPYRDQLKDLKKEYKENKWLDADEQKLVLKAYKLLKDNTDLTELLDMYNKLACKFGTGQAD